MKFETRAIRLQTEQTQHREHSTPMFPTSSFVFENSQEMAESFAGDNELNIYSRFTNPTVREFEIKMAALENMANAFGTATGMAAVFASLMPFLQSGDHIIAARALFGSSYKVITETFPRYQIQYDLVNTTNVSSWEKSIKSNSKILYVETPTNPGLEIIDLEAAAQFARKHELLFIVDNCFATPYLQNPADFGADLVTHSATKHIDGQGRVLGGAVCGNNDLIAEVKAFCRRTGPSLSPFNAWILSKSLETLAVRMDRHCSNAEALAEWLQAKTQVAWVRYPFLESHPSFTIAKKQMKAGGGILCFEVQGGLEAGERFLNKLQMFSLTANLGDTRSIATHPASTTHSKLSREDRLQAGITDGMIRISVGLEHIEDIISDLDQAL